RRRVAVTLERGEVVGLFLAAGGAADAPGGPLAGAQRALQEALGPVALGAHLARGDPGEAVAEGTAPRRGGTLGSPAEGGEHLDVGAQERPAEVVLAPGATAVPEGDEPLAGSVAGGGP